MTEEHNRQQTPSQAEGDRETVERDLEQKFGGSQPHGKQGGGSQKPAGAGGDSLSTPSQAEGERDTIDRDLNEKS